ncbi:hypothetical protein ACFQ3H_06675 [Paralysiella testudinis]|uniref:hypothetical protein n=1 Tax=Paralysiella testudinis TaxID=2809020 RepID=UPI00363C0AA2
MTQLLAVRDDIEQLKQQQKATHRFLDKLSLFLLELLATAKMDGSKAELLKNLVTHIDDFYLATAADESGSHDAFWAEMNTRIEAVVASDNEADTALPDTQ